MSLEELKILIKSNEEFEKEITNLQVCGYCLDRTVEELPWSKIKEYLIYEMREVTVLDGISSLYRIKDKILKVIMMIEDQDGVDEVLRLLDEMKIGVNNLINYIEEIGKK